MEDNMNLAELIRDIPDFPSQGILFRDITTLLKDPQGYKEAVDQICRSLDGYDVDVIVGPEARGFILGSAAAYAMGTGLILARKPGKLPAEHVSVNYGLEYGTDSLAIHKDAIRPGQKIAIVDDLLATGGTAKAACKLCEELGGQVVALRFLIELGDLSGRETLEGYDVKSLITY
ncbi:MAG: adenine phosphoribosyltransferase [Christensenellales bacterium]|jgi:adenine phosphoribosyltransferase